MSIYKISYQVNKPESAAFPQVQETLGSYDFSSPNSFRKAPISGRIDFPIQFPKMKMENKAKETDLIQCVPLGNKFLVVSPTVSTCIMTFNIDEIQTFTIDVIHKKISHTYHALYFPNLRQDSLIDWENSTFFVIDKTSYTLSDGKTLWHRLEEGLSIRNYQDYLKYLRELHARSAGKQALKTDHIQLIDKIEFDLFKMSIPLMGYFCSSRLKTAIEQAGLTGFRFEQVSR
ncbi:MAG: hypothetical protein H6573_07050 [Lewinellaceae bacterium]|nr:hypothetical protein [Lewinellaceae bacterium]